MDRVEVRASGGLGALGMLGEYEDSSSDSEAEEMVEKLESESVVRSVLLGIVSNAIRDGSSGSSNEDGDSSEEEDVEHIKHTVQEPKVKGELRVSDLPPIEDLFISVPTEQAAQVGTIFSIVDSLVVVKSLRGIPAIDLDSVLFLNSGQTALGNVFDVIGPVTEPFYVVRFNSSEHIQNKKVEVGMDVFFAPRQDTLTSFIFLAQLRDMKGSDASWIDDIEPPIEFLDYSDDEMEREVKKDRKNRKRAYNQPNPSQVANNPFYRRSRAYNPRENGPITWNTWTPQPNYPSPSGGRYPPVLPSNNMYSRPPPPLPGTSSGSNTPIWNNASARGYWSQPRRPT